MSRVKNASRNIVWGVLNKIVVLLLPFITRTVMIYTLGMEYVGLNSLFTSILQVLSFAELGIGSALVFSMYEPMAENDDKKICALLNLYKKTYRIIGVIILAAGLAILPFLNYFVNGSVPNNINLQILFVIYLLNNLAGYFLFAYKQALFTAAQRVDVISKVGMILQLFLSIFQVVILILFKNYYMYSIAIPIVTIVNNIIICVVSDRTFPQYKCYGCICEEEKKDIEKKVGGLLFQKIGNIILTSADTIVISSFLGLRVLGIYNGYYYVITALLGFLAVIQQAIIPAIGNSVVLESKAKNLKDFRMFHLLYMWIVIWWCCCLSGLYQPFISIWQGSSNMLSDKMVMLFVMYFFCYKMGDVCWMYREAIGLWWEARYIPLISSIVNLIVNIILVNCWGLAGVLISSILALAVINFPWSSKVLFLTYFKSKKEWISYMSRNIGYFIIMIGISFITSTICSIFRDYNIISLIIRLIICLIIPNVLLLVLNIRNEYFKNATKLVISMLPHKAQVLINKVVRR